MRQGLSTRLVRRLKNYRLGIAAAEVKNFLVKTPFEVNKLERRFLSLEPGGPIVGNVLLAYINDGFFLKPGHPLPHHHTHFWESMQIAQTFLSLGYRVDVIDENNDKFAPSRDYSVFVSNRNNFDRVAQLLNGDCLKIYHADLAHWLFHNAAVLQRVQWLQQRRGLVLPPRRSVKPSFAMEHADCATILGNEFTLSTYRYAGKPMYRVSQPSALRYPWFDGKDFESCRKNFLWFGSGGLVRKGLDLTLEAFADMPDYHLTVCGPVGGEPEFERAYYKELHQTPNIRTMGWTDIASPAFLETARTCVGLVFPSCSEGQATSVVTCLHAGLIPIVSYESGVDVGEFGVILRTCALEEIKTAVQTISALTADELGLRARGAWEYARATHTREQFTLEYRRVIESILATEGNKKAVNDTKVEGGKRKRLGAAAALLA